MASRSPKTPAEPSLPADHEERAKLFVDLLAQHERGLSGYIVALVPNWSDADDVLQETKLRLWEQFEKYDPSKDFGGWARAIAHFQVLTYRKQSNRHSARYTSEFVDLVAIEAASVAVEANVRHRFLDECMRRLGEAGRKLLILCYAGNLSIKEVALRLGRSIRGLQNAVAKLRKNVQQCVENRLRGKDEDEDEDRNGEEWNSEDRNSEEWNRQDEELLEQELHGEDDP
jgi:RNA polymerase sigma-70 factor (ECF subfamily)